MALEKLLQELTDLNIMAMPKASKEDEEKFKKFLVKKGRASSCDVTFETESISLSSCSRMCRRGKDGESNGKGIPAPKLERPGRPGIGRGSRIQRTENSAQDLIETDLENFFSRM